MKKAELVFIPSPGVGHLVSTVELAKLLLHRYHHLSISVLVMQRPVDTKVNPYLHSLNSNINIIRLPNVDPSPPESSSRVNSFISFIESHRSNVREAVAKLVHADSASDDSPRLAGFVLDMFCTSMIEVANDFGVPSYVFYTSSAAFLGLKFYAQALYDEQKKLLSEVNDSETELEVLTPSLVNSIPVTVLPVVLLDKDWRTVMFEQTRGIREVKGILVNTFLELESYAVKCFADGKIMNVPPLYTVGPILNLNGHSIHQGSGGSITKSEIMEWLDDQPPSSVVFLCFGSTGSFHEDQVKEIAFALERSGHRFLWSLRQPPTSLIGYPTDYANLTDVLPEEFLNRTAKVGKVIGWAPQVSILSHKAIGGFVSHCGWNSVLESVWCGVPIATWPMFADQQLNAFQMVIELGLGVEIKMDYVKETIGKSQTIVSAEEIEKGIKKLMEDDGEIRKRMVEMSAKSKKALVEGESSFCSLDRFIDDVLDNIGSKLPIDVNV